MYTLYLQHFNPDSTNDVIKALIDGYTTSPIAGVHRDGNNFAEDRKLIMPEASSFGWRTSTYTCSGTTWYNQ